MRGVSVFLSSLMFVIGVQAQEVIIMPDSTNNRLVTFSPVDGSVINPNVFGLEGGTPVHALQVGNEIWVSEQIGDRISRWSIDGAFLGAIGPAGLDNIRGMALINGKVHVANFGTANGAPGPAVVMFDTNGNPLGFFSTAGTVSGTWHVLDHQGGLLVSSSNANDDIHRYTYAGASLGTFHNSTSLNFAEQMAHDSDGNVLVGGFSSNNVVRLDKDTGAVISSFPASGARGVFQLRNGNILWTNSSGAHVYNVGTGTSTQVYVGGGRHLDLLRLRIDGDANGDGCVDDRDLLIVLFSFGETGEDLPGDLNDDRIVDDLDLLEVLFNFGNGC